MNENPQKNYFLQQPYPQNWKEILKSEIRLHYINPTEINESEQKEPLHFQGQNFTFYGYKVKPLNTTFDSEKYKKQIFSEFIGVMILNSGEVYIGEFTDTFKPNGEGIILFVTGSILKSYFHDGKVHNNTLISYPFGILVFAKFNKGMVSQELWRIDTRENTFTKIKYVQGKFREIIKEDVFEENTEVFLKEAFSINIIPENASGFNEHQKVYFGTFLLEDKSLYYGFIKNGLAVGWGAVVRLENNSPSDKISFTDNSISWYFSFFSGTDSPLKGSAIQIDSTKFIKTESTDNINFEGKSKYIEVNDTDANPLLSNIPAKTDGSLKETNDKDVLKLNLKPIFAFYRQSKLVFGLGNDDGFNKTIGIFYPHENKFIEAFFASSKIYFNSDQDPVEGIPRTFIPLLLKKFLKMHQIKKMEELIVSPIFNMTYFNDAFLFYLFGLLKFKAREFFPDHLNIIRPNFLKNPAESGQSNTGSVGFSDLSSNGKIMMFTGPLEIFKVRNSIYGSRESVDFEQFKSESQVGGNEELQNQRFIKNLKQIKVQKENVDELENEPHKIDKNSSDFQDRIIGSNLTKGDFVIDELESPKFNKSKSSIPFQEPYFQNLNDKINQFQSGGYSEDRSISPDFSLQNLKEFHYENEEEDGEELQFLNKKAKKKIRPKNIINQKNEKQKEEIIEKNNFHKHKNQDNFASKFQKLKIEGGDSAKNQTNESKNDQMNKKLVFNGQTRIRTPDELVLSFDRKLRLFFNKTELTNIYQNNSLIGGVVKKYNLK